jgi:hypothetical protein
MKLIIANNVANNRKIVIASRAKLDKAIQFINTIFLDCHGAKAPRNDSYPSLLLLYLQIKYI